MSLKLSKHLLIFFILIMFMLIPASFAQSNNTADEVSVPSEETIIASSDDVVENTSTLIDDSAKSADVNYDTYSENNVEIKNYDDSVITSSGDDGVPLSQSNDKELLGADYQTIPNPSNVDYTKGESKIISVSVITEYGDWISSYDSMKVFINGATKGTGISGVSADADEFEFDLKDVSDQLNEGTNTLVFHPDTSVLYDAYIDDYEFTKLTVTVGGGEVAEKFLYVATNGNDDTGEGSKDKPYATIDKAISTNNDNGGGYTVLVNEGTYTISSNKYMSKDITIKALGNVIIDENNANYLSLSGSINSAFIGLTIINGKGNAIINPSSSTSGNLKVYNCTFINNTGQYSIIQSYSNTDIKGCSFINNTCKGSSDGWWGLIASKGSGTITFNLNNNIFLDNIINANAPLIYNQHSADSSKINAKDNYWGSNDGIDSSKLSSNVDASSWVALVTSISNNDVSVGDKPVITTQFKSTTDGKTFSDLSGVMPNFTVSTNSNLGTVDSTTTITKNTGNLNYVATKDGEETVNILYKGNVISSLDFKVDLNIPGSIYVATTGTDTTGDGSKNNPYATISYALGKIDGTNTIIVSGGNYILSNYQLTKSVTIIGKDNVIITPSGTNYILNIGDNAKKVNLTRLTFANATAGAITMSTNGNGRSVDISECNFINNKGSVGAIALHGSTTITKSNFINNTATSASGDSNGIISVGSSASLTISYSNFIGNKNTATSSSAISDIYATTGVSVIANNNFWGSNDKPNNKMISNSVTVANWVSVVPTIKDETDGKVTTESNHEITLEFKSTTDGKTFTELADAIPDVNLNLEANLGTVTPAVTLTNNVASANYKSDKEGSEKITIKAADNVTSLSFTNVENENGRIYVATTGTDTTGDGSKANPYATIEKATSKSDELGGNQEIIVYAGNYQFDSAILFKKALNITARNGEVIITTDKYFFYISISANANITFNGLTFINANSTRGAIEGSGSYYNKGIINLNNCKFINNTVNRVLDGGSYFSFNVNNCTFINNTADSYFFYSGSSTVNINNSIFLNNTCDVRYFISASSGVVDNNFWGSNDKPSVSGAKVNNWIVLVPTINNSTILSGSTYDVNLKFMSTTDGKTYTELSKIMDDLTFDLTSVLGNTFTPNKVTVSNNEGSFKYYANKDGMEKLSIVAGKEVVSLEFEVIDTNPNHIYVATNGSDTTGDGSKINPFKSIAKALTKAINGKCTIYIFDGTYNESALNISNSVSIVGMGDKVVINGSNANYIFAVKANNVNLNMSKLTLANGKAQYGGAIQVGTTVTGYDANVYIENVKFINNTATTSGGAIYNSGGKSIYGNNNLTIVNCTFENGKANYAGAIETHSDTTIMNSIFRNNTLADSYGDGAAIRMNGGITTISNCIFESNNVSTDKGTIRVQSGSLNVTYSVFLDTGKAISASSSYYDRIHVDYNFWATNNKPTSKVDNGKNKMSL